MTRFVVVTGTSTDVGKTIATAALAARAAASGERVLVVKPCQTGIATGDPTDCDVVAALTGVDVVTFTSLPEPLAPDTAARRAGVAVPTVAEHAAHVREVAAPYDVVIVEGAGGLLVRLDLAGGTLLDLGALLAADGLDVEVVVVCAAALGTLNHSELTVRALRERGLAPAGLVVGAWPAEPGLAERCNLDDLPVVTGSPLLAVLPEGSGALSREAFLEAAPGWFSPAG